MYTEHIFCRACGKRSLEPVADFGVTPLVNDFSKPGAARAGYAPLNLTVCTRCWLPQLSVVVDPHILYDRYAYIHSDSAGLRKQFADLTAFLEKHRAKLGSVLEFGSNDGLFLSTLKDRPGVERVFGIDPAQNLVVQAQQRGVSSHCALFSYEACRDLGETWDTIVARHVFSHIDDWKGVIRGLETITDANSIVALEVQYGPDLLLNNEWDQIYHEHLSYLTLHGMEALLTESALHIVDVLRTPWMGGSIVVLLKRGNAVVPTPDFYDAYKAEPLGSAVWRHFYQRAKDVISNVGDLIDGFRSEGKSCWGYACPAKAANWVHQCHFTNRDLLWVTDTTPFKQGCYVPGSNILVVDPKAMPATKRDDVAILFAWNFQQEIIAREIDFVKNGGRFLVPLPEPRLAP